MTINIKDIKSVLENSSTAYFNFTCSGASLTIYTEQPSQRVITDFRRGDAKFALYEQDGMLFFMSNFGANGWLDAPFHASLNPPELAGIPPEFIAGRHHLALAVSIQDAESSRGYGARLVTLPKEFSARLVEAAKAQLAKPISRSEYHRRINAAFAKLSASAMARNALVRCRGGANETADFAAAKAPDLSEQRQVTQFTHISLNTGHTCAQTTDAVSQPARELLKQLITKSEETGWTDLQLDGVNYPLAMKVEGTNLSCELYIPVMGKPMSAVKVGVALDATNAAGLWRSLHDGQFVLPLLTDPDTPPASAWVGAVLKDELLNVIAEWPARYLGMLAVLGDFERCLAFAFADYIGTAR